MEAWKCTMLIEHTTAISSPNAPRHRVAGWSESVYDLPSTSSRVVTDFRTLCGLRASLLPIGAVIVGQRYQRLDTFAPSQSDDGTFPAASGMKGDLPSIALYCKVRSTGKNFRPLYLRGVPDDMVIEGEYKGSGDWHTALLAYGDQLDGYYFRGKDLTAKRVPVDTVDGAKLVTTVGPHGFDVGNVVRFVSVVDSENVKRRFQATVSSIPSLTTFHYVTQSPFVGGSGTVQNVTVGYQKISAEAINPSRIVTKKVGRPFTQFVGRR